jgi:hypothetical protein
MAKYQAPNQNMKTGQINVDETVLQLLTMFVDQVEE